MKSNSLYSCDHPRFYSCISCFLLICSVISFTRVASSITLCRSLPLNPTFFSTYSLAFTNCLLEACRADDKADPDIHVVPPKGSSGWIWREIWILGDREQAGDEPGCIMRTDRKRYGQIKEVRSGSSFHLQIPERCRVGVSGETYNEIFFIHIHSEPEERTSLEIKDKNIPPRRRRYEKKIHSLETAFLWKAKGSESSSVFCEGTLTSPVVFRAPAAHAPCGCTLPWLKRMGPLIPSCLLTKLIETRTLRNEHLALLTKLDTWSWKINMNEIKKHYQSQASSLDCIWLLIMDTWL